MPVQVGGGIFLCRLYFVEGSACHLRYLFGGFLCCTCCRDTDLAGGDEAAIMRSLSKLARLLPPDTVCLTGHGDSTTMARELMQNPFMRV